MSVIAEKLTKVLAVKNDIKQVLVDAGENMTGVPFDEYAEKIQSKIPSLPGHSVRFWDIDGTLLKEEIVQDGQAATAPTPTVYSELTFVEWTNDFDVVTYDMDIGANYVYSENAVYMKLYPLTSRSETLYVNITGVGTGTSVFRATWSDGHSSTVSITNNAAGTFSRSVSFSANPSLWAGDFWVKITRDSGPLQFNLGRTSQSVLNNVTTALYSKLVQIKDLFVGGDICYSILTHTNSVTSHVYKIERFCFPKGFVTTGLTLSGKITIYPRRLPPATTTLPALGNNGACIIPSGYTSLTNVPWSIDRVIIPEGVTTLPDITHSNSHFYSPSLRLMKLKIPKSVTNFDFRVRSQYIEEIDFTAGRTAPVVLNESDTFMYSDNLKTIKNFPTLITSISTEYFRVGLNNEPQTYFSPYGFDRTTFEFIVPPQMTNIGSTAFASNNFKKLTINHEVASFQLNAVYNCRSLEELDLSNCLSVTPASIATSTSNSRLRKITFRANSLPAMLSGTFQYLPYLEELDLSNQENVTSINFGAAGFLVGCTRLRKLKLPPNLTTFTGVRLDTSYLDILDIPAGVSSLDGTVSLSSLYCIDTIVLRKADAIVTLTSAGNDGFQNTRAIYVPDALVEDYKVATNWSVHSWKFFPLSSMPTTL